METQPASRAIPGEGLKAFSEPAEVKADFERREITGYASRFGNVDLVGDVVVKGAFARTIAARQPKRLIKVFYDHMVPIGMPVTMAEDDIGLLTVSKVHAGAEFDKYLQFAAEGQTAHMSFAYDVVQRDFMPGDGADSPTIRVLKELKLWEYGPVHWPANEMAEILGVKAAGEQLASFKAQIPMLRAALAKKGFLRDSEVDLVSTLGAAFHKAIADAITALASSDSEPIAATTPTGDPPPTADVLMVRDPEDEAEAYGELSKRLTSFRAELSLAGIRAAAQ